MSEIELNKQILELHENIKMKFSTREREILHLRSIENFIRYLIIKDPPTRQKNSNTLKVGIIRKKELLSDYLRTIEELEFISEEVSNDLFKKYIIPIGNFMSTYFDFSFIAGKIIFLKVLTLLLPFIILDFTLYTVLEHFYFLTPVFGVILLTRYLIKFREHKVYGMRW